MFLLRKLIAYNSLTFCQVHVDMNTGVHLCVCNRWDYAGNCADVVDRLFDRNQCMIDVPLI